MKNRNVSLFVFIFMSFFFVLTKPLWALEIKEIKSDSGIYGWFSPDKTTDLVSVYVVFRGGTALDEDDKQGATKLLAAMLTEGAGDFSSQEYQRYLESYGIDMNCDAGSESFSCDFKTISKNADKAFELLGKMLTEPLFEEEALSRMKESLKADIRIKEEKNSQKASKVFFKKLFPDHPLNKQKMTKAGLDKTSIEDLKHLLKERLVRKRLIIGVSGNIDEESLEKNFEQTFSKLPNGSDYIEMPSPGKVSHGDFIISDTSPTLYLLFGHQSLARDNPDFYGLLLVDYILGGGSFDSRLNLELRQKRGLVYSTGTSLSTYDKTGLIAGTATTDSQTLDEVVGLVKDQWRSLYDGNIKSEELEQAKKYIIGSFPLSLDSSKAIARLLAYMQKKKLGIEYLNKRTEFIDSVSLEEAKRIAHQYLNPDNLIVVAVGSASDLKNWQVIEGN